MKPADMADYLDLVLWPHCSVLPSVNLYRMAATLHAQTQYRYDDCLIVAAALASGAAVLWSEDLQHGRTMGSLRIENPFA
jgi:predicted nucleic acid-binding protein